jgi:8-oxo-dGTP pyrophosphatase MutT (NUDIX family)
VNCWLVRGGNIIFQRRSSRLLDNPGKLYTTASGHISAGESVEDAFRREMREELGADIANPIKMEEGKWTGDFKKTDGSEFHDRVFYNFFFAVDTRPLDAFRPQPEELDGLVEIDMKDTLRLFADEIESLPAKGYLQNGDGAFELRDLRLSKDDFLCTPGETLEGKYGSIIRKILEKLG